MDLSHHLLAPESLTKHEWTLVPGAGVEIYTRALLNPDYRDAVKGGLKGLDDPDDLSNEESDAIDARAFVETVLAEPYIRSFPKVEGETPIGKEELIEMLSDPRAITFRRKLIRVAAKVGRVQAKKTEAATKNSPSGTSGS